MKQQLALTQPLSGHSIRGFVDLFSLQGAVFILSIFPLKSLLIGLYLKPFLLEFFFSVLSNQGLGRNQKQQLLQNTSHNSVFWHERPLFLCQMPQFHQVSPFFLSTTPVPQHFPGTKACCLLDIAKISSKTACTQAAKIWKCSHISWILKIKMKNLKIFLNGWERSVTLQNPFITRLFLSFGRPVNQTVIFYLTDSLLMRFPG